MKNIDIFISSTFCDMQSERDYIRKHIIPQLNNEITKYGIHVNAIDLRWGINNALEISEEAKESKVLHICLQTIQHTKPYFIAILGDRYGWEPSVKRLENVLANNETEGVLVDTELPISVTEMEILFGAIGKSDLLPHSFFMIRDSKAYNNMDCLTKKRYCEPIADDIDQTASANKLKRLKSRIIDLCHKHKKDDCISYYLPTWNEHNKIFTGLEDFGKKMYSMLLNDILADYKNQKPMNDEEFEYFVFENFIQEHLHLFSGRKQVIEDIVSFLLPKNNVNTFNGMILSAEPGYGKTAVFCKVYSELKNKAIDNLIVLACCVGISNDTLTEKGIIMSLTKQLSSALSIYNLNFKEMMAKASMNGKKIIVMIDSMETCNPSELFIEDLDCFSIFGQYFFSCTPQLAKKLHNFHSNLKIVEMPGFSLLDAKSFINKQLEINHKQLSPQIINLLLNKKNTANTMSYSMPIWLNMSMILMMELGAADFFAANKLPIENEAKKIEKFLESKINKLPNDVKQCFIAFLIETYKYFSKAFTYKLLVFISCSRFGVSEEVLADLFAEKWDGLCFYSIYCWMKPLLYSRFDGRISFKNQILRQILKETDTNLYQKYHKQYYEYIAHKADNYNKEKEVIDMTEYLVLTNDSDSFAQLYECIEKEGNINFCTVFVNLIHEYEDETINFLTQLCQKYYEFDSLIIQDTIESLSLSDDYLDHTLAKKLFSKTNLTVPIKQLKNGNSFIWMAYRPRIENMLASYISNKKLSYSGLEQMVKKFEPIKELYFFAKSNSNFVAPMTFYQLWGSLLFKYRVVDKTNEWYGCKEAFNNKYKLQLKIYLKECCWNLSRAQNYEDAYKLLEHLCNVALDSRNHLISVLEKTENLNIILQTLFDVLKNCEPKMQGIIQAEIADIQKKITAMSQSSKCIVIPPSTFGQYEENKYKKFENEEDITVFLSKLTYKELCIKRIKYMNALIAIGDFYFQEANKHYTTNSLKALEYIEKLCISLQKYILAIPANHCLSNEEIDTLMRICEWYEDKGLNEKMQQYLFSVFEFLKLHYQNYSSEWKMQYIYNKLNFCK